MPYGIVYLLTHTASGKQYVGQTVKTLKIRWNEHVCTAGRGSGHLLHDAIREFGENAFTAVTLLECATKEDLNAAERRFIREYNSQHPNGYNLEAGGSTNHGLPLMITTRIGDVCCSCRKLYRITSPIVVSVSDRLQPITPKAVAFALALQSDCQLGGLTRQPPKPIGEEWF